ncbi:hypothetical protein [Dysgonomonas sp. 25]|uniref:hypothetical protein n=1 Tax=Dysgonomonas sp. 25 TaxID=2302933 RepID=UPI001C880369|nr:hypothetical protein [Dysgonomonas sp. 25]
MGIYPVCYIVIACAPGFFEKGMQKNNSVFDFILPGSTVEKYLVMLVNYVVLLPLLCFAIVFLLVQLLSVIPMDVFNNIGDSLLFIDKVTWGGYLKMLAFQSFFLTGYMYFKRYSFLKTLLIIVGVFIFFQALSMIAGMIVFGNMEDFSQASQYSMFMEMERLDSFQRMESFTEVLPLILAICFPFGLWVVSFFKLREKEI